MKERPILFNGAMVAQQCDHAVGDFIWTGGDCHCAGAAAQTYNPGMKLHLIWAQAKGRVIGLNGVMPWHLPEDLAHFKQHTQGCPVIMGRKTWESLPPRFRPLPGRRNIVISRQTTWQADGAELADSLQAAQQLCATSDMAWVIGGAQIYAQALPFAQRVVMTQIEAEYAGDTFAPELGPEWHEASRNSHETAQGLKYSFVTFDRR